VPPAGNKIKTTPSGEIVCKTIPDGEICPRTHIINLMDDHDYTNKSNAANARMQRKCIMKQKQNTQSHFPVQLSIHPAPQNQVASQSKIAYLICRKRTPMRTQA